MAGDILYHHTCQRATHETPQATDRYGSSSHATLLNQICRELGGNGTWLSLSSAFKRLLGVI